MRGAKRLISPAFFILATAALLGCSQAASLAPAAGNNRGNTLSARRDADQCEAILHLAAQLYPKAAPALAPGVGGGGLAADGLAEEWQRSRLSKLAFPGPSDRLRFVAEGAQISASVPPGGWSAELSYIAWRDGGQFAVLGNFDNRILYFSCTTPKRTLSAALLAPGIWGKRPTLVWSNRAGVRFFESAQIVHGKPGSRAVTLELKIAPSDGFKGLPGLAARVTGIDFALAHNNFLPPQRNHRYPCIFLAGPTVRNLAASHGNWIAVGHDRAIPCGRPGFLLSFGAVGVSEGRPVALVAGTLGVAPLAAGRRPDFPKCSAVPGKLAGIRIVEKLQPTQLANVLTSGRELAVVAQLQSGHHRLVGLLSRYPSLDRSPRALYAYLSWVGGTAADWYRHHGVRRLAAACARASHCLQPGRSPAPSRMRP